MNLVIYDTFNDYIESGDSRSDNLCYVKESGSWFQGGHKKSKYEANSLKTPTTGCGCGGKKPVFVPPDDCEDDICGPHPCRPPLSIIEINGIKYWTWDGRLLLDCDGNPIPIDGQVFPWNSIQEYIDRAITEAIERYLANYVRKDNLTTLTVDNIKYYLYNGGNIDITNCKCDGNTHGDGGDTPVDPHSGQYSITYNLTNCTSSRGTDTEWVSAGSSYNVTITANNGYAFKYGDNDITYTMGGSSFKANNGVINISNVAGNITITASAQLESSIIYSVTVNAQNCTWSGPTSISYGGSGSWTITANNGYTLQSISYKFAHSNTSNSVSISNNSANFNINNIKDDIIINAVAVSSGGNPGGNVDPLTDNYIYIAFCEDKGNVPAVPSNSQYLLRLEPVNNSLSGEIEITNPVDGYTLFIWAPENVSVPNTSQNLDSGSLSDYSTIAYCNQTYGNKKVYARMNGDGTKQHLYADTRHFKF